MDKVIIVIFIAHLLTTAFGLAVIESVKPVVYNKLRDKGYTLRKKNSLYEFNDKLYDIMKLFIPFYYFSKALSFVGKGRNIDVLVEEEIKSGKYISKEELEKKESDIMIIDDIKNDILVNKNTDLAFEKPEKYTARKNDISIYDTYETPIEYITRETKNENVLDISPYKSEDKVVEHVVVKSDVSKSDIAKAIAELDINELEMLKDKIINLVDIKKKDLRLKLEKDVA